MSVGAVLILVMWLLAIPYIIYMIVDVKRHWEQSKTVKVNVKYNVLVSAVSNFFDTLGIGSFAIATSAWKFKKSMPDHLIPGTLNAVFVIPMCIRHDFHTKGRCRSFDVSSHDWVFYGRSHCWGEGRNPFGY